MTKKTDNEKNIFVSWVIWLVTGIIDYANTSAIYVGYLTPALQALFKSTLQYVFFPIYLMNSAIYAALAINNVIVDRDKKTNNIKKENIIRLAVNLTSTAIVATAVVGTLAFSSVMGVACTFLYAANLGLTAVYNYSGGFYHLHHFLKHGRELKNPNLSAEDRARITEEREEHRGPMISYFAVAGTITLVALAGTLAVLGGFLPLAGIGIAAGVLGVAFCIYGLVRAVKYRKSELADSHSDHSDEPQPAPAPDSTTTLMRKLNGDLKTALDLKAEREEEMQSLIANDALSEPAPAEEPRETSGSSFTQQTPLAFN